jgi:hypothetical protein
VIATSIGRVRVFIGVSVVAALVVGGTVVPAGAAGGSTSPQKWANGVCSAVQDWINSVESTLKGLKNAGSLDAASQDAINGLDTATSQLEDSLKQLGKPSTSNGAKAQSAIQDLSTELSNLVDGVKQELANPPSDPVGIASTFAQIGSDAHKATSEIKSTATTRKGLASSGQLKKAFQNASSCQSLKKSI